MRFSSVRAAAEIPSVSTNDIGLVALSEFAFTNETLRDKEPQSTKTLPGYAVENDCRFGGERIEVPPREYTLSALPRTSIELGTEQTIETRPPEPPNPSCPHPLLLPPLPPFAIMRPCCPSPRFPTFI